jgi:hypothetical protein
VASSMELRVEQTKNIVYVQRESTLQKAKVYLITSSLVTGLLVVIYLCSLFKERDRVSNPYKTTDIITMVKNH